MSHSAVVALIVAGVLGALAAAAASLAWRDPAASKRRFEALFRRPRRPPKAPGRDHYYRPYWS